ncbi:MAG: SRPBCC family protein [Solirubrobacteraceae bacterium]
MTGSPVDIQARRTLTATPEEIFGFLADLENHWLITDRFVEIVDLAGPPGARTGGRVRVRGPLGVRRTATTSVDFASPVREMGGSAQISGGTVARVRWLLTPNGRHTDVTLGATIERAGPLDRLLLRAGGMAWMRSRFEGALRRLEHLLGLASVSEA